LQSTETQRSELGHKHRMTTKAFTALSEHATTTHGRWWPQNEIPLTDFFLHQDRMVRTMPIIIDTPRHSRMRTLK
jgi:hypothetical protein